MSTYDGGYFLVIIVGLMLIIIITGVVMSEKASKRQYDAQKAAEEAAKNAPASSEKLAGAGLLPSLVPATVSKLISENKVIPLFWDSSSGAYVVNFVAGLSNVVAVFDTGSARFIVASNQLARTATTTYTPTQAAVEILDPRSSTNCTSVISYVSQSDTIQVFEDSIAFPRKLIKTDHLCKQDVSNVLNTAEMAVPLTITNFPIGVITANTGDTSLNVFGMSAVQSSTMFTLPNTSTQVYLLPSCQLSYKKAYESALVQAFANYYEELGQDVIWSMMLGNPENSILPSTGLPIAGMVAFSPISVPCLNLQYTPMVSALPDAPSQLSSTPGRYYVVEVDFFAIGDLGSDLSTYVQYPFPKYMLVDSGTTNVLVPNCSAGSLSGCSNSDSTNTDACQNVAALCSTQQAILVLKNNVVITYGPQDVVYGGGSPVFVPMDAGTAGNFSSSQNVGILGNTGMRNLYVEFNLTRQVIGFAQSTPS